MGFRSLQNFIFNSAAAVIIATCSITAALADNMGSAFARRNSYQQTTNLGNPSDMQKFANPNQDTSHLQNLNDASLMDRGADELNTNPFGKSLQDSEERKIEAMERYKINAENPWLKNSFKLEADPLSRTGGRGMSVTEVESATEIKKSCTEGVDFNVDVGLELILKIREQEYLGPLKNEHRQLRLSGRTLHDTKMDWGYAVKWKTGRWGWIISPYHPIGWGEYQVDSIWQKNPVAILADARAYIAHHEGLELENVGENIIFPREGRGLGSINSGFPRWRVVWDEYEFGYDYIYREKLKRLVEEAEYWQVVTEGTEKLAESNECYETGRTCLRSGVKTFLGKYNISRPCWYEKISYRCKSEPKEGCAHLYKQDCRLDNSECEHNIGSICLKWKRDFTCFGKKKELRHSLADSPIYCLGGDCHTPTLEEDGDFANVAYLAALNEASKDCVKESNGICKNPITVFPGEVNGCRKIITGFLNCCSAMKGWGKNVNLGRCSSTEQGLALKRDRGLCHAVGTYCKQKAPVTGTCAVKKTNYCCFSSKLARIFHEQGRKQLNINWGSGETPNCRALTIDELTRLDFSQFDMEELFDALLTKGKSNQNKGFPTLIAPGEIPEIQKEHMQTAPASGEAREIRRRDARGS